MAKKEGRKPLSKKRARIFGQLLLLAALAACCAFALLDLSPTVFDVAVGAPSPDTIHAPYALVDEAATAALVNRARESAKKVYAIDDALVSSYTAGAEGFFDSLLTMRTAAFAMLPAGTGAALSADDWRTNLTAGQMAQLRTMTVPALEEDALLGVLASAPEAIQSLGDIVVSKLSTALEAGLSAESAASVRASCAREVNAMSGVSSVLKHVASLAFDEYMKPTLVLDEAATKRAQDAAAAAVEPVTVKKGELIAERGEPVTEGQYAILAEYGLVRAEITDEWQTAPAVGVLLLLVTAFLLFDAYLLLYRKEVVYELNKMLIISVLVALTAGLAFLSGEADARFSPALVAIMLCALLADERAALALTPLMAVALGVMTAGEDGALGPEAFSLCASTLASGAAAVAALRGTQSRGALIGAGAAGGAAASLAVVAVRLLAGDTLAGVLVAVAWTFGGAMISTLLVTGSLSLWEVAFDVATPARLSELGNANQPLLRELMKDAPGTYQHSVLAGTLAEAAAERVGADPLLARVACYYHDVGKLRRPLYFMENQKGENIHDSLAPLDSAQAIIAHQKDGVQLLTKHKLPSAIVRICAEHHGNSLVSYFYHKAKLVDENVPQRGFRYPAARPSTKESAIVMLADCCEAAVRSLGDTSSEAVAAMVHRIIWAKLNPEDNQLANAPLTLAELTEIEKSFLRTFAGIMHDRIEYPDPDEAKR